MCLTLVSCKKSANKILIDSTYGQTEPIELTSDELKDKLAGVDETGEKIEGDDFILYIHTSGCSSCAQFERSALKEFIEDTGANIFKIEQTQIEGLIRTPSAYQDNPRLCIFKEGTMLAQTNQTHNKEVFLDEDELEDYLEKYCVISPMQRVTFDQLQRLIQESNMYQFFVYYQMSGCGDCAYFEKNILKNWLKNNKRDLVPFFVYDVLEFRKYKTEDGNGENEELYNNMVNICKLDINGNRGKYPTLIHYVQGERKSYCVYFNDELEYNETNKTYKVVNTPYGVNEEIVGKVFNSYDEYQKLTSPFHERKFNQFMESIYERED